MNKLYQLLCCWIVFCGFLASAHLKRSQRASKAPNSEWTEPSQCSRTCGGGVAFRERICSKSRNSNGDHCESEQKYFLCNTQDCPQGSSDFREVQCQQFDNKQFDGKLYKWIPYFGAENQCALNCLAKGEQFYRRLADKVVDGTPCDRNTLDVCIEGTCQPVGCDRVLGSKRVLDACLICGGYGATCRTLHGTVDTEHMEPGYNRLLVLPEGATSITLQEERTSKNYFAVRNLKGIYYLNGNLEVDLAEPRYLGQTFFEYRRPHYGMEYLSALGPLQEPLVIELLKQPGISPAVNYDYSVPSNTSFDEVYAWIAQAWKQCNASCGIGYLNREVSCINVKTKRHVDSYFCHSLPKPSTVLICHHAKCTADWYIGEWESCSKTCGHSGTQVRKVFCQKMPKDGHKEVVSADQCPQPKPEAIRDCNSDVPCAEWMVGDWSECIGICGSAEQTRAVICKERQNGLDQVLYILPDQDCDPALRPSDRKSCDLGVCLSAEWMVSEWSGCGGGCDGTIETRQLKCSTKDGHLHPFSDCDHARRPETSRPCPVDDSCNQHPDQPQWFTSQWSSCSVSCGSGAESRAVFCGTLASGQVTRVPSYHCDPKTKLVEERECSGSECSGLWFTGPFGKCSTVCGGGQRTRELFCFIGNKSVDLHRCDENTKPEATEDCNQMACDDDNFLMSGLSDCRQSQFGCCPDQLTAADGSGYLGCASDPIPPGLCIDTEFGCCQDGITSAEGPFQYGCYTLNCQDTEYGCCADGETPATGADGEGCIRDENDLPLGCRQSIFGCCSDGLTAQTGLNGEGCYEKSPIDSYDSSGSGFVPDCETSAYRCCPDNKTPAKGPNNIGCHGYSEERPERAEEVGADVPGEQLSFVVNHSSQLTDVPLQGFRFTESPHLASASAMEMPLTQTNIVSPSTTPSFTDPVTEAPQTTRVHHDQRHALIRCHESVHGCCLDGHTPASGPNYQGCVEDKGRYISICEDTPYGCCKDGVTPASGPNDAQCPHLLQKAVICTLPNDPGPCNNRSMKWFYDASHGNCEFFEYGGCGGNENRFDTSGSCRKACISPDGIERCYLPQSSGRCRKSLIRYSYNPQTRRCEEFIYGGCLGNENRFSTVKDCEKYCVEPQKPDVCNQLPQTGLCRAYIPSYYFDPKTESCKEFIYGGCGGNENRFESINECEGRCGESLVRNCRLPLDQGPCQAQFYQWYFNSERGLCEEFKYGGCLGNANRFRTKLECEKSCKRLIRKTTDICSLLADTGSCRGYFKNWYYDKSDGYCKEFVYGGCGGNENRFSSEPACRLACDANLPIDVCTLPADVGHCKASVERYYFDGDVSQCLRFVYGGCEGNGNNFQSHEECQTKCSAQIALTLPPEKSRCLLPRDPGPCIEAMVRWHYSPIDRRCVKFEYGGCGGNLNRFFTESTCKDECGYLSLITTTSLSADDFPDDIHSHLDHIVPATATVPSEFHIIDGVWEDNEVLPSKPKDDVPQKPDEEFAEGELDSTTHHQPEIFLSEETENEVPRQPENKVPDVSVNSDHGVIIPTVPEDSEVVGASTVSTGTHTIGNVLKVVVLEETHKQEQKEETPVDYGNEDFGNEDKEVRSSGEIADSVPMTGSGHVVSNYVLLTNNTKAVSFHACSLHANPGPCKNSVHWQWHYDQEIGECVRFKFGGCEGNENNFESEEACLRACPVKEICQLMKEVGPCYAVKSRYFFDTVSGSCQPFTYGGCQGNANRFLTIENCQHVCETLQLTGRSTTSGSSSSTKSVTGNASGPPHLLPEDVCSLPEEIGPCRGYIPSYYFSPAKSACLIFAWGGCGGNANRFSSVEECEQRCIPAAVHYTRSILPSTSSFFSTVPVVSSTSHAQVSPLPTKGLRHWDICKMRKEPGPCADYAVYWYFEPVERHCRRFYYGGCGGNTNKYNSSEECHARCLNFESALDLPLDPQTTQEIFSHFQTITPSTLTSPPLTTGHMNPSFLTSSYLSLNEPPSHSDEVAEGEPVVSACDLPSDAGRFCSGWSEYWYFDSEYSKCRRFYYGGCDGNNNRFVTEQECMTTCAAAAEPEASTTAFEKDVCLEPKVTGPCTLSEVRWYFDQLEGKCLTFTYGGCHGSMNNFETEKDCLTICKAHLKEDETDKLDVCSLPKDTGPCLVDYLRFYWSPADKECRSFVYGGCQGNGNNFATQEECYKSCGRDEKSHRRVHIPGDCFLPAATGPCNAAMPRWYYESAQGDCRAFYYGGCHGNGNNFLDYEDCIAFCNKVSESCGVLQCDFECPYGFEHGPDGCPLCRCLDPCKNVSCPENSRCHVENVTCTTSPCSNEYKSVCKSVMTKPGSCPSSDDVEYNSISCSEQCLADDDCPAEAKCCQKGCSRICVHLQQPEEAPVIESYPESVTVVQHSNVLLHCSSRGAPRPQVMWFKDSFPILDGLHQSGKFTVYANGTLHIRDVDANDAKTSFSCRAFNNIGADTLTYTLVVNDALVPAEILNEGETETTETVKGSTIELVCTASGVPLPTVHWFKDGLPLSDSRLKYSLSATGLQIFDVDRLDSGDYTCRAENGIGRVKEKLYRINIIELMSIEIFASRTNVTVGENVKLQCRVISANSDAVNITWSVNSRPLSSDLRFKVMTLGELLIESTKTSDSGEYTCTVMKEQEQASASVFLNIRERKLPEKCVDKPWYANCDLIVEAGLCHHAYFSIFCCSTCHRAGHLP